MNNFFAELKRRNVYKVAVAYAVFAWFIIQIATQLFPFFEIPNWAVRLVVVVLVLGFPAALVFSWAFEITPEGIKRESEVRPNEFIQRRTGRKIVALTVGLAVMAAGLLLFQLFGPKFAAPRRQRDAATPAPEKSIAVLPFQNLSKDEENAFFADGVQDEILTNLAKVADLKVISRTSVMQYKDTAGRNLPEIAQALKVAHVLEGSVQRSGNRVRVTAQLIDARTDAHLWAEHYDRNLADVFAIQSEIARAIADQLQARISPKEKAAIDERPTADLKAYDLYLVANQLVHKLTLEDRKARLLEAVRLLDEAVARDPAFLLAHYVCAYAHDEIYGSNYDRTPARLALAEASVKAVERLRPDSGEAHLARATHLYWGFRDYDRAREELAKAEASLPNNAEIQRLLGFIDRSQGRWEDSIRHLKKAAELDPRDASLLTQLTGSYGALRRYSAASEIWKRLQALDPQNPLFQLGLAYCEVERNADTKTMRAVLTSFEAKNPAEAHTVASWSLFLALRERDASTAARALALLPPGENPGPGALPFPRGFYEGMIARLRGDEAKALASFSNARAEIEATLRIQPDDAVSLSIAGRIDALLGQKEDALREGRRACEIRPAEQSALSRADVAVSLARIYATTGEKEFALEQLTRVVPMPGGPSYGDLKLEMAWDSLRGEPRFEKLVASLAPKPEAR